MRSERLHDAAELLGPVSNELMRIVDDIKQRPLRCRSAGRW